jgi:hypothetical protein
MLLYGIVVLSHDRRRLVHVGVSFTPSSSLSSPLRVSPTTSRSVRLGSDDYRGHEVHAFVQGLDPIPREVLSGPFEGPIPGQPAQGAGIQGRDESGRSGHGRLLHERLHFAARVVSKEHGCKGRRLQAAGARRTA